MDKKTPLTDAECERIESDDELYPSAFEQYRAMLEHAKQIEVLLHQATAALEAITRCAKAEGAHGTTVYFISDDKMVAARDVVAKSKAQP